jgi:hypothetical protein
MRKAESGCDRRLLLGRVEQRIEAVVAISLKEAAEPGQVLLRMLAAPIAGGVVDRGRRRRSAKLSDVHGSSIKVLAERLPAALRQH